MTRLCMDHYEPGTLVLVRNTAIEKSHNRKSKPRYLGPYEVVRRTNHGAYVLKELDGAVGRTPFAAFRIVPYISRKDVKELRLLARSIDSVDKTRQSSDEDKDADGEPKEKKTKKKKKRSA